jgi:hypothetical protein
MGSGSSNPFIKEPEEVQPIRLIDFDDFKLMGQYPRFPEDKKYVQDVSTLDLSDAFVIFVSHLWLRSRPSMENYKQYPRPDTEDNKQYKLCVAGVENLLVSNKIALKKCFLWIDYGCVDQGDLEVLAEKDHTNKVDHIKAVDPRMGQIMHHCDCMLTPDTDLAELVRTNSLWDREKVAHAGHGGYLNRGWCILEMFYATFIPLSRASQAKQKHVSRAVEHAFDLKKRPHFVFGEKEMVHDKAPLIVPVMRRSAMQTRDPVKGYFTHEEDVKVVKILMKELAYHYMKPVKLGYQGNTDAEGLRHGHGRYEFPSGAVYEGGYQHGLKHGFGRFEMASGDVVSGVLCAVCCLI